MSVSDDLRSSQHWLTRAEECRALAESFHHHGTRERMLKVAEEYQRMGDQAAARELVEAERAET
jgi:hypothetical protein